MNINEYIDHTLLKPSAKRVDIVYLCRQAVEYRFRGVCVNPEWVVEAKKQLIKFGDKEGKIKVAQVLNFPTTKSRIIYKLSNEIDLLLGFIGIGKVKNKRLVLKSVEANIERWMEALKKEGKDRKDVKLIIETRVLTPKGVKLVSRILQKHGIGCIKSSTGLYRRTNSRTNLEDLKLIKSAIKLPFVVYKSFRPLLKIKVSTPWLKVSKFLFKLRGFTINIPYKLSFYKPKIKIAGGIKTYRDAQQLIRNGADILGCSSSVAIMKEIKEGIIKNGRQ